MIEGLALFSVAYAIAAAIPGPAQSVLLSQVVARGGRASVGFIGGMVIGNLTWLGLAMAGLAALALRFESLFIAVKWLGIAYLVWLAWRLWREAAPVAQVQPRQGAVLPGLLLTLGNPKAVVFFGAVLPQAFDMSALSGAQMVVILMLGALIDLSIQLMYLLAGVHARRFIRSARGLSIMRKSSAAAILGSAGWVASRG